MKAKHRKILAFGIAVSLLLLSLMPFPYPGRQQGAAEDISAEATGQLPDASQTEQVSEDDETVSEDEMQDTADKTGNEAGMADETESQTGETTDGTGNETGNETGDETGDETESQTGDETESQTDETTDVTESQTDDVTESQTDDEFIEETESQTDDEAGMTDEEILDKEILDEELLDEELSDEEEILDEELPVTFSMDTSNTPASRYGSAYRDLSGFAAEAVYENNGNTYQGLLSECWDLAMQSGGGTITLITDVEAYAYDPSIYDGPTGTPHAITRFIGGLSTMNVESGMNVTLDLNGHVLDRNMSEADGTADRAYTIEVFDGGLLTLTDSVGTGKLTGGYGGSCGDGASYGSSVIVHEGGTFVLSGAEISGNTGYGAVVGQGSVELTGNARILDNLDQNGSTCNLYVSGDMDVTAQNLTDSASIGLSIQTGRESDAVYYAGGTVSPFHADNGATLSMDGNYIVFGESQEVDYQAEFHANDGSVQTGTLFDMLRMLMNSNGGTVKLMKDVNDTNRGYHFTRAGTYIIDFNGHVVTIAESSTGSYLNVSGQGGSVHLILKDSSGRIKETARRVDTVESPVYDPETKTYTYYISYAEDGGTDTGMVTMTDKIAADLSRAGGINSQSTAYAVCINGGSLTIEGGAYRSNGRLIRGNGEWVDVILNEGLIYDCKVGFDMSGSRSFKMTGGVIAGCSASTGGAIYVPGSLNQTVDILGGTITQCKSSANGGVIYSTTGSRTITITNSLICNNSAAEGGAIYSQKAQILTDNASFVNNHAKSGGAVLIGASSRTSSFNNSMFIGNTAVERGGAIASRFVNRWETAKMDVSGSSFIRNTANTGGALDMRNSMFSIGSNSIITLNSAKTGGGIYFDSQTSGLFTAKDGLRVKNNTAGNVFLTDGSMISTDAGVKTLDVGIMTEREPGLSDMIKLVKLDISNTTQHYNDWFVSDTGHEIRRHSLYLVLKTSDNNNVEWTPVSGTPSVGTFWDMWDKIKGDGTLKLLNDAYIENMEFVVRNDITLDLNGHMLYGSHNDNSKPLFTVESGHTFIIQDKKSPVMTDNTVNTAGKVSYNDQDTKKVLTYYAKYPTADFSQTIIKEVESDITECGGISAIGHSAVIQVSDEGHIKINGGVYQSLCPFLSSDNGMSELSDAYVFNNLDIHGGTISGNGTLTMKNMKMIGCSQEGDGGAVSFSGQTSIKDSLITQCCSEGNGGGIAQITGSLTLSKSTVCLNSSKKNGGGLYGSCMAITDTSFTGNSAEGDGAGLYGLETEAISVSGCSFLRNTASGNGGGIYLSAPAGSFNMQNTTVSKNNAELGDGCYVADGILSVGEGVKIINNQTDNLYLSENCLISADGVGDTDSIALRVTTQVKPEKGSNVKIAQNASDKWFSTDEVYGVTKEGNDVFLFVGSVEVQFYAIVDRLNETQSGKYSLSLIDTSGGSLPKNYYPDGITQKERMLYLDADGVVMTHKELLPIYEHVNVLPGYVDIDVVNKFYRDNYVMYEVWVSKDGTDPMSTTESEWDITPYEKGMSLNAEENDTVRIVAKQTEGTFELDTLFYDYDITDGYWYGSGQDAVKRNNPQMVSPDADMSQMQVINARQHGINSAQNYSGTGTKLAFGNGNMGTVLGSEKWNTDDGLVHINRFNRASDGVLSTFKGGAYGLVTGLDENGNLIYAKGIDAPMLFNKGHAVGKTTYADYGFEFLRNGDTYTLSSVTNTGLTGLEKFKNPGPYNGVTHKTVIWTNEFWPMDWAPSYSTPGHDAKFGLKNRNIHFINNDAGNTTQIPPADAMIDHNSYFGFQFEVKFTIPDGYRGPMEYIFFGDDDMWVFLDGKLVCDIGGVHSAVGEYVNLWDYLQKDDTSEHTLSFFWTERGASGSTCWMQFVIPNINSATEIPQAFAFPFTKTDTEGNPLSGVEFTMYDDEECTVPASVRYSRSSSKNNGRVVFTDLVDGQTYYIKETGALEGYAPDNSVYVLTQDKDRTWFMHKMNDENKTPVNTIVNRPDGLKLPDTGSREAMVLMYIASILLSCSMLAFYIAGRKRGTRHEDK